MENGKYVLVTVSEFGFLAYERSVKDEFGSSQSKLSGYSNNLEYILDRCGPDLSVGCVFIDNVTPDLYRKSPTFTKDVLNSPLVNVDLVDGEVEKCPPISDVLLSGLSGEWKALALKRAINRSWRGLDSVSISEYSQYWLSVGARVGVWNGTEVIWTD